MNTILRRLLEIRAGRHGRHVDGVDEVEKALRIDLMMQHQAAQARAVVVKILLLDAIGLGGIDLEKPGDERADMFVDLRE